MQIPSPSELIAPFLAFIAGGVINEKVRNTPLEGKITPWAVRATLGVDFGINAYHYITTQDSNIRAGAGHGMLFDGVLLALSSFGPGFNALPNPQKGILRFGGILLTAAAPLITYNVRHNVDHSEQASLAPNALAALGLGQSRA